MVTKDFVMEQMGEEIALINNEVIKNLVVKALMNTALDFYKEGASSTGKFHPKYAQGEGGLVRHVKAAVYFAKNLTTLEMYEISDEERDIIIAALILHDSCKRGINFEKSYTVHEHPLLVSKLLNEEELSFDELDYWYQINELISSHMGQWVTGKGSKTVLPKPITKEQQLVHLCDYLASRKEIELTMFNEYSVADNVTEMKIVPASEAQKKYLSVLIRKAKSMPNYNPKYSEVEVEDLTQGMAGRFISELLEIVGE